MILLFVSFFLLGYVIFSFIHPLPCRPLGKILLGLFFLAVSQKFLFYQKMGGAFFAPDLPRPLLLVMETLYASLVILFFLLLMKDILGFALWVSRQLGTAWHLPFTPGARNVGLALAALGMGAFGVWQSVKVPDVRTVEIVVPRLPQRMDGLTLAQLSDIHIGPLLKGDWLRAVVEKTNALHPAAVLITGDMIDGTPERLKADIAPLADLRAAHGVFGVTGNHEYYYRVESWLPVFKALGIDMLHNEHRVIAVDGGELVIAGVPDVTERRFVGPGPDADAALAGAPEAVRLLMAHQPKGVAEHRGADVQFSGHTHGGLLFFLKGIVALFNEGFVDGLYDVGGLQLYVNPGTGLWNGFSCRLGVPSEISRIVLRSQPKP